MILATQANFLKFKKENLKKKNLLKEMGDN